LEVSSRPDFLHIWVGIHMILYKKAKVFGVGPHHIFSKLASDSVPFESSYVCVWGGFYLVVAPSCVTGVGRGTLSLA
jgi:hypothetical protein